MKKTFLILALLATISNSFAGQVYVSASGYNCGVPNETLDGDYVYISDYYNYVTIDFGSSNIAGPSSFSFTDIVYTNSSGWHRDQYWYGPAGYWGNLTTTPVNVILGNVNQNTIVEVALDVYGVDTWATINY